MNARDAWNQAVRDPCRHARTISQLAKAYSGLHNVARHECGNVLIFICYYLEILFTSLANLYGWGADADTVKKPRFDEAKKEPLGRFRAEGQGGRGGLGASGRGGWGLWEREVEWVGGGADRTTKANARASSCANDSLSFAAEFQFL